MQVDILPTIWIALYLLYHSNQQPNIARHFLPNKSYTIFTAALLHTNLLHLVCNVMSWYGLKSISSTYFTSDTFYRIFIFGCIASSLLTTYMNQKAIGASGGLYAVMAYLSVFVPFRFVVWSLFPLLSGLNIPFLMFKTYFLYSIFLTILVDGIANYFANFKCTNERLQYILNNINLFRYGMNNISFYGHLGGAVAGWIFAWEDFGTQNVII